LVGTIDYLSLLPERVNIMVCILFVKASYVAPEDIYAKIKQLSMINYHLSIIND